MSHLYSKRWLDKGAKRGYHSGDEESHRMHWRSRKGHLYAIYGSTVGLGNSWRFPILLCNKGGGAYLIPYTCATVFFAIPFTYMELCLGQFSTVGPLGVCSLCPLSKGVGAAVLFYSIVVATYYNVLCTYSLYFLFSSFVQELPWEKCSSNWASENCYTIEDNRTIFANCIEKNGRDHCISLTWQTPTQHFWKHRVLGDNTVGWDNGLGSLKWDLAVSLLVCSFIVFLINSRGTRFIEKVMPYTTVYPYIGLAILMFITLLDEGSGTGIAYLFTPHYAKLKEFEVWRTAIEQSLYSLGISSGSLIVFGSYCPFRSPANMDAITLNVVDYGTSLCFGIVMFNCLGAISYDLGTKIDEVLEAGPLSFVVMPEAITHLPGPTPLWSIIFYSLLFCVGISTEFCLMATYLSCLYDAYPNMRKYKLYCSGICSTILFFLGLVYCTTAGSRVTDLVDTTIAGPVLLYITCFQVLVVSWIYGIQKFTDDIHFMLGFRPSMYWKICWLLSPVVLMISCILNIVEYTDKLPILPLIIRWVLCAVPITCIVGFAIHEIVAFWKEKRLSQVIKPTTNLGPVDPILRKSRSMFCARAMTKEFLYRQTRLHSQRRRSRRKHHTSVTLSSVSTVKMEVIP